MAGNFQTKNVFVDTEYDNIIIIDPNLIQDLDGQPKKRLVQHEDLVYYANLETKVVPRTKLAVGEDLELVNTGIASFVGGNKNESLNFLQPKKSLSEGQRNFFDTSWSDQITGKDSRLGGGANQKSSTTTAVKNGNTSGSKTTEAILNYKDTQTLGIKTISVKVNSVGVPTVDITLVDVQGRTLFEQGENSLYSVFFNLPYPAFYLTLKGYYGKAIRYQLALISFNAKLDSKSGNFDIQLKLIGRPGALLFDTLLSYAVTLPKMYQKDVINNGKQISSNQVGVGSTTQQITKTTLGRQELETTYNYYESKGLIPEKFPRLSIEDFTLRIEGFNKWLLDETQKGDFQVLSDVYRFREDLISLKREVFDVAISEYLDTDKPYFIDDEIWYPYKKQVNDTKQGLFNTQVKDAIDLYVGSLKANASFGDNGKIKIPNKPERKETINVNVNYSEIVKNRNFNSEPLTEIEYQKTFFLRYGKTYDQSSTEYTQFRINLAAEVQASTLVLDASFNPTYKDTFFFKYGNRNIDYTNLKNGFLKTIEDANAELDQEEKTIESELSEFLATTASSTGPNGLGFVPTIRNVFAILFAGVDSFYRLMDKVHTKAWDLRKDPKRLSTIKEPTKLTGVDKIVYPWPLYYEPETKDGKTSYVIQYIGDGKFVNKTNGNNYSKWPEVEFTEEFIVANAQKLTNSATNTGSGSAVSKKASLNSIYRSLSCYPSSLSDKIIAEILERSYVNSHYGKFNLNNFQKEVQIEIGDLEGQNILETIINSPILINFFQNEVSNATTFVDYIKKNLSTSVWFNYNNNIYSTGDLVKDTLKENQSSIYSVDYLTTTGVSTGNEVKIKIENYIKSTVSNENSFLDVYPFTNKTWLIQNMANSVGNDFNDTTKVYVVQDKIKKIARLKKDVNGVDITLITNPLVFNNSSNPLTVKDPSGTPVPVTNASQLKDFYKQRTDDTEMTQFYVTESKLDYGSSYNNLISPKQTNTLFNTPYFVNAIMEGVELEKTSGETPYAALGYLFLNSLPLITTRERLKSNQTGAISDLDYLSASFNKISALHQVPYAWVLKYGSIWNRYKRWVETGVDILDNVWKDFDAAKAYNPTGNTKDYNYFYKNILGPTTSVTLQFDSIDTLTNERSKYFEVGVYPKLINDVYYYFSKKNLFSAYTSNSIVEVQGSKNLIIDTTSNFNSYITATNPVSTDLLNKNAYMKSKNNLELPFYSEDKYLLFPSFGDTPFNQAVFECFDDNKNEKTDLWDNKSFYNGSVRSLWGSPNFGYFQHNLLKKPLPNEYIKKIKPLNLVQSSFDILKNDEEYSSIEEIFGIFDKETLDIFEKYFLLFIDTFVTKESVVFENELFSATLDSPSINLPVDQRRLYYLMKNLFVTKDPTSKSQMESFTGYLKDFLNNDVLLRLGNPGHFDRKLFNDFSESAIYSTKIPQIKNTFQPYKLDLPPVLSLTNSQSSNASGWAALQTYVGFSTISELAYSDQGSYITDFFKEMNMEFTENNIVKYNPLIKLFATKKLEDPNYNKLKFLNDINDYLTSLEGYQTRMLTETITYLKKNLPTINNVSAAGSSILNGNVAKLEMYSTFKALNDKWISGSELQTKTLFEDFLFLDRANNDIGDKFTVDLFTIKGLIENNPDATMMDIVSKILGENNFIFFAMPAYINFYNLQAAVRKGEDIPYEIPNSMFGTYLNVDYVNSRPKFLCMYVGKPSENLDSSSSFNLYDSDTMDLTKAAKNDLTTSKVKLDKEKSNLVVGFNVDFGIQHQNIFKDLSLDMSEKKNTAESFKLQADIANSASGNKVAQQSTSLYSLYKTRSYTCGVSSMGNVMIQPTMYFNLRHVPLFRGAYWIKDVSHNIDEREFKTEFTGIRMPIFTLPDPDSYLTSINKNLLERIKPDAIKRKIEDWPTVTGFTKNPNAVVANTPTLDTEAACKSKLFVDYENYSSVTAENRIITNSEYITELNGVPALTNINLKRFLFGITLLNPINTYNGDFYEQINVNNYNLYGFKFTKKLSAGLNTFFPNKCYTCAVTNNESYPYISFESYKICIEMGIDVFDDYISFVPDIVLKSTEPTQERKIADALARIYISTVENDWPTNPSGTPLVSINAGSLYKNTQIDITDPTALDAYIDIFERVINLIN